MSTSLRRCSRRCSCLVGTSCRRSDHNSHRPNLRHIRKFRRRCTSHGRCTSQATNKRSCKKETAFQVRGRSLLHIAHSRCHPNHSGTRIGHLLFALRGRSQFRDSCTCTAGGTPCGRRVQAAAEYHNLAVHPCDTSPSLLPVLCPSKQRAHHTIQDRSRTARRWCRLHGRCKSFHPHSGWSRTAGPWSYRAQAAGRQRCSRCSLHPPKGRCRRRCREAHSSRSDCS